MDFDLFLHILSFFKSERQKLRLWNENAYFLFKELKLCFVDQLNWMDLFRVFLNICSVVVRHLAL